MRFRHFRAVRVMSMTTIHPFKLHPGILIAVVIWASGVLGGSFVMFSYASKPGEGAAAPTSWPMDSEIPRTPGEFTLLLFAHPNCPCTMASLEELMRALANTTSMPNCFVVFTIAPNMPSGWESSDLVSRARSFEQLSIMSDIDGVETRRFGAATSGHVLLYNRDGRLLYSGGITASRGHEGDSIGKQSVIEFLNNMHPAQDFMPVYGCPLFDDATCTEAAQCPV